MPWVCTVIVTEDVRISYTPGCTSLVTFLSLPYFDVICDLFLSRLTTKWKLFIKLAMAGLNPEVRDIAKVNVIRVMLRRVKSW